MTRSSPVFRSMILLFTLLMAQCCLSGCNGRGSTPLVENRFLMGTYVSISSYDGDLDKNRLAAAMDSAFGAIGRLEAVLNPYDSSSMIGKLNQRSQVRRTVTLNPEILELISAAFQIANETNGRFDFTLWPVFRLWHFDTDSAAVPPIRKILQALPNVDYGFTELDSATFLLPKGVEVDFGGIAKGFAVEVARRILKGRGLKNFIIDAGGNLGIEWHQEEPVQVYVRHPRREGQFWGHFPVKQSCGIATSGDYHFYFLENGQRYHHILDPQTGYPARQAVSTTIVAPNATLADGYSTAVFVMGHEVGRDFIETHPELEGLIIYPSNRDSLKTYLSPALREIFIPEVDESLHP